MGSLQFPNMGMGLRLAAFGRRSSAIKENSTIDCNLSVTSKQDETSVIKLAMVFMSCANSADISKLSFLPFSLARYQVLYCIRPFGVSGFGLSEAKEVFLIPRLKKTVRAKWEHEINLVCLANPKVRVSFLLLVLDLKSKEGKQIILRTVRH